ncbi:hypothetical protein [Anaerovorax sp. IOR16]|uniref:hypothetical protein n=1 Tax=Anaerovorax sp. IOR16 TaxID=2773458 RepID=UPI0019D079BF|nr:hypothetical protein [Anaerovorax sp. IOR16]
MDTIILHSDTLKVIKINRKTKAKMFKNLKVGDTVQFSVPIKKVGRGRSGTYATYIKALNIKTGEETESSFNQIPIILDAFEFENQNEK